MKILPAINVAPGDEEGLVARLEAVRGATDAVHLDVCDGTFTDTVTWTNPFRWQEIAGDLGLQVHLMVANPEPALAAWLAAGATELVVHLEALGDAAGARLKEMKTACEERGAALFLACGMEVGADAALTHASTIDGFLVLAVHAGPAGQMMDERAPMMIEALRAGAGDLPVWVDGGVNAETIPVIRGAGATAAVATHAVFDAPHAGEALAALQLL